jgi:hypothetical protein
MGAAVGFSVGFLSRSCLVDSEELCSCRWLVGLSGLLSCLASSLDSFIGAASEYWSGVRGVTAQAVTAVHRGGVWVPLPCFFGPGTGHLLEWRRVWRALSVGLCLGLPGAGVPLGLPGC